MAKFLVQASYSAEGLRGLQKETATSRRDAVAKLMKSAGATLDSLHYAFGKYDVVSIVDVPDNSTAAALTIAISAGGLVKTQLTPLLTVEEVDAALKKSVTYRPPGR